MIPDNVTLIVKAHNQQIEDQNIECHTSWTVRELKGHLAEVYPNKPKEDEQKIIYSGQLLDDNSVIKDVLRHYDSQNTHTMHLVCSTKRMTEPDKKPSSDGLRQRNVPETLRPAETPRPEMRQNDQNHTVEMQNYFSSFVNNYGRVPPYPNYNFGEALPPVNSDPASMANHMLMMQQAYMQYMQQYANMAQTPDPPTPPTPEQPPRPEPEQEDQMPRDWLDHLYAASRFAILVSLFCLYGSPARLLLIILLAAAGYLHQIGFFRDLNVNPVNNAADRNGRNRRERNGNEPAPNGTTKTVHILHNSEQPASVFSILESGTKNIHVIADGLFDLLMMKLSHHYTSKKQTKIESKGPRFELGDFCVKLGSVTMNQNFKGVLIEVEYRPCVMANAVWGLLREFLQGLLGPSVPVQPPQHLLSRMNEIYTPIDTIYQYLEHFSAYRKTTGLRSA